MSNQSPFRSIRCKECDMYLTVRDAPYRPMCKACANDELDYLEEQEQLRDSILSDEADLQYKTIQEDELIERNG